MVGLTTSIYPFLLPRSGSLWKICTLLLAGTVFISLADNILANESGRDACSSRRVVGRIRHRDEKSPQRCPCCKRPQDEIWLLNTRHLGTCPSDEKLCRGRLEFYRYTCHGWKEANEQQFFASDNPCTLTSCYVHGNRMDMEWVYSRGFKMYDLLRSGMPS